MLVVLLIAVLLLGLADSIVGPYLVLFGADAAHLSPWQIGVLSSVTALSGMAVSIWLARRYDRRPGRWPALVAVLAPAAGYLLLTTTTAYAALLVIAVTLLGAGLAAFPQLFALAKARLSDGGGAGPPRDGGPGDGRFAGPGDGRDAGPPGDGVPDGGGPDGTDDGRPAGNRTGGRGGGTPVLRSVWSLAWAVGPLVGAVTLSKFGFTGLFVVSAVLFAAVAVPLAPIGPSRPAPAVPRDGSTRPGGARPSR